MLRTLPLKFGRCCLAFGALALILGLIALAARRHQMAPRPPAPVTDRAMADRAVADFTLPPPGRLPPPETLWATWYWTPTYVSTAGVPLLAEGEKPLGPHLPRESFCRAAVEGAVRVDGRVYTLAGIGPQKLTDCRDYWPTMTQAPYVRFEPSDTPYGEGVDDYQLAPYRTLAVDESQIPIGTVLYVPAARGCALTLPDGRRVRHDGYFFAEDDGYGVHGSHVDVYIGVSSDCPFPWVVSRPDGTFPAYVVTDPKIVAALRHAHLPDDE